MSQSRNAVVPFPTSTPAPTDSGQPRYVDVTVDRRRLRVVPDSTGQDGFRAYVVERDERLGVEHAVEVPLPSRGALLAALTGLTPAWRKRLDVTEAQEPGALETS